MRNTSLAMLTAAGLALVSLSAANATPVNGTLGNQTAQENDAIILVADGCGRGRHYSRYRGMCVSGGGGGNGYRVYANPEYRNDGYRIYGSPSYGYGNYGRSW